ncbi:hypothetical protein ABH999_003846 [Bradyrhizobium yuanmingense]
MAGGEIGEERGDRERRQPARAALRGDAHRLRHRRKAADAGGDDRRGALERASILRCPFGLRDGFCRREQREQDEAVHLALILGRGSLRRIKTAFGIIGLIGHEACNARRQRLCPFRQRAQPALPGEQPPPRQFDAAAKRRHRAHSRHDDTTHVSLQPARRPGSWP